MEGREGEGEGEEKRNRGGETECVLIHKPINSGTQQVMGYIAPGM